MPFVHCIRFGYLALIVASFTFFCTGMAIYKSHTQKVKRVISFRKIDNFMRIFRENYANAYFDLFFEQNGQNTHMRI